MKPTPVCPTCSSPLPPDAPAGLCPKCLLASEHPTHAEGAPAGAPAPPRLGNPPSVAEIGRYFPHLEILECIGQGGMGVVYKARQPRLDRLVALKVLHPDFARDPSFTERFTREARALAKISHPGIVAIHDVGYVEPFHYLIMEYVDGVDLRRMLRAGGVKPAEALRLVVQICEALQFAHDRGVVHRDIKPGNILVDRTGRVKLADFGLAKLLDPSAQEITLTSPDHVMGTPQYMAPEQRSNPLGVDHRADIYSLGVVFYEMLTGNLPVGRFPPPSERVHVDVRLDEVVLRTLEQEPARRYQHANDVKSSVEQLKSPPTPATPGSAGPPREPPDPTAPKLSSRRRLAALGLLLVVGAALAAGFLLRGNRIAIRETPPNFGHFFEGTRSSCYALEAPVNHRIVFWTEWLKDGRPAEFPGVDVRDSFTPARGKGFKGYVDFYLESNAATRDGGAPTITRGWGLRGSDALTGGRTMAEDPFHGLTITDSSYGHRRVHRPRAGEDYTLLVVRGDRDRLEGNAWDPAMAGRADLEMRLWVRVEPVPAAEVREGPQSSGTAGPKRNHRSGTP